LALALGTKPYVSLTEPRPIRQRAVASAVEADYPYITTLSNYRSAMQELEHPTTPHQFKTENNSAVAA